MLIAAPVVTGSLSAHWRHDELSNTGPIALEADVFEEVMVFTDDEEIADIARWYGAEVPFMRSERTSDDQSGHADVLVEVLEQYEQVSVSPELVACVLPTAPLFKPEDLSCAVEAFLKDQSINSIVPILRFGYPIQRAFQLDDDGRVGMVRPEHEKSRSKDLLPRFHDAGQFYVVRKDVLLDQRTLFPDVTLGVELPETRVQDIDSKEDWRLAELKFRLMRETDDER